MYFDNLVILFDPAGASWDTSGADHLAPDGSQIRLLPTMKGGGLCHCILPAGKTSSPVSHHDVEEIWYVLEGHGEVWLKAAGIEETVRVNAATSLTIPPRTGFQFRNTRASPLCIVIATMLPWPGPREAGKTADAGPAGSSPRIAKIMVDVWSIISFGVGRKNNDRRSELLTRFEASLRKAGVPAGVDFSLTEL